MYTPDEKPGMHRWARARLFQFAKRNRWPLTPAEQALWDALSNKKIDGLKFRRQHPCGAYILDFYCHSARVCIEVDGGYHRDAEQRESDQVRTNYLTEAGIRVLRLTNAEVLADLEKVIEKLRAFIAATDPLAP